MVLGVGVTMVKKTVMTPTLLEFAEKIDINQMTTYINIELDMKINAVEEKYIRVGQNIKGDLTSEK